MNYLTITKCLALALFTQAAAEPRNDNHAGFDGQYPPAVETIQVFDCATLRAQLKYRQDRLPPDRVDSLAASLRVRLLELSAGGRTVGRSELEEAQHLFRGFAWITSIEGTCFAGRVTLALRGMPLAPFIASLDNDEADDLPDLQIRSLRLGADGIREVR